MNGGPSQFARVLADAERRLLPSWARRPYQPYPGFDPLDGHDERVTPPKDCPIYGERHD